MRLNIDYLLLNIGRKRGWHGQKGAIATVAMQRRGFTLIEALIAIVLVGIAIAALVVSNQSFTSANGAGLEVSTAEFLIEQIREFTVSLPVLDPQTPTTFGGEESGAANYDDICDFAPNAVAKTFSPPIDSKGLNLTAYPGYSQQVTVENVNASDLRIHAGNHSTAFYRITVKIFLNNEQLSSASWLRANY